MISLEKRKEIFNMYFIEFNSIRKISSELNISRSTLSKIINEYKGRLKNLGLLDVDDLSNHIDSIVLEPKRKKRSVERYIITQEHIDILEDLIKHHVKVRTQYENHKIISKLPDAFYTKIEEKGLATIAYSTYYTLAREIKDKLGIPYSKRNSSSKKDQKNITEN